AGGGRQGGGGSPRRQSTRHDRLLKSAWPAMSRRNRPQRSRRETHMPICASAVSVIWLSMDKPNPTPQNSFGRVEVRAKEDFWWRDRLATRRSGHRADALSQPALVTSCLVTVDLALVDHGVDDRHRRVVLLERIGLVARPDCLGDVAKHGAQLGTRGDVVLATLHRLTC